MRRRRTQELAFAGVFCALSVSLLCAGGILPFASYTAVVLAAAVLLVVREECRRGLAWACFFAAALLSLLLTADRECALAYCCFGYYPLLKPRFDALRPAALRAAAKTAFFALAAAVMAALLALLLGAEALLAELAAQAPWLTAVTLALLALVFVFSDIALTRLTMLYRRRRKKR